MLKERESAFNVIIGLWDIVLSILVLYFAVTLRAWYLTPIAKVQDYQIFGALIVPIWFVLLRIFNLTQVHRFKALSVILIEYFMVVSIGMGLLFLFIFLLDIDTISRFVLAVFAFVNLIVLVLNKYLIMSFFKYYRSKGYNSNNLLVLADNSSIDFIDKVITHKFWGCNLIGIVTDSEKVILKYGKTHKIYPKDIKIMSLLEEQAIDELIYARKGFENEAIKELIFACEEIGVTFRMKSQLFTMVATKAHLNYFDEIPFLTFTNTPTNYLALMFKSVFDKLFALFAILLASPIMIIMAIWIKLDSKGPILFTQKRVGLRGREFGVFKFRTMVTNAEELKDKLLQENEQEGPVFKMKKDPRITNAGRFLRKTSLDELPQFFNVLFGDMSVVGPRPPVPREVVQYERWQLRRLSMKPGITCIWQVSGRNEIGFEEWMRLDLQYIDSWSLKLDFILIFKTIGVVLKADGH